MIVRTPRTFSDGRVSPVIILSTLGAQTRGFGGPSLNGEKDEKSDYFILFGPPGPDFFALKIRMGD